MLNAPPFFSTLEDIQKILSDECQEFSKKLSFSLFNNLKIVFYDLINDLTQNHAQVFPSYYSRIYFIIHNHSVPENLKQNLLFLNKVFSTLYNEAFAKEDLNFLYNCLIDIFSFFYDITLPYTPLKNNYTISSKIKFISDCYLGSQNELVSFHQIVVDLTIPENDIIICHNGFEKIEINCSFKWKEIPKIVKSGTTLNCINLKQIDGNKFCTNFESFIIVEPDYLYDITDIAQCFTHKGTNAYIYFINKFFQKNNTFYIFIGNLVNQFFDDLLIEPENSFESLLDSSIKKRVIVYLELKKKFPELFSELKRELEPHYRTLQKISKNLKNFTFKIESTFFSAIYGLIGRMDLLLESSNNPKWKTIIELKSGNPPNGNVAFKLTDKTIFYVPMWHSHYAQTIGYNLLADSAFPAREGSSMILYSKDIEKPLREATNDLNLKREFIKIRNWIYLLETQLAKGKFSILDSLKKVVNHFEDSNSSNNLMLEIFYQLKPEVKNLILNYIKFLINEIRLEKIGNFLTNYSNTSQSTLWSLSIEEKQARQTILANLKLDLELSDLEHFYLHFSRNDSGSNLCALRKGDPVVVYNPANIENKHSFELLKGTIKTIEYDYVRVSLRNKFSSLELLNKTDGWIIEEDFIESTHRYLFQSLFKFIQLPEEKINYLLGYLPPYKKENAKFKIVSEYDYLVKSAIDFYPFFLVVGPPGTGKTRKIIFKLIEYYYHHTENKILICAYTNRAVDEIVSLLENTKLEEEYIRIGTKESSDFKANLLPYLLEEFELQELENRINNCRIFLGTAHSLLSNSEIFRITKFNVAIIDEASQLLFPHLAGIISEVDKFILIGDEKQLPAVSLQENYQTKVKDKLINELGYKDLCISYFEFLLSKMKKNNWKFSFSTLNVQYRMHPEVLKPINKLFYECKIQTSQNRIANENVEHIIKFISKKFDFEPTKRVIFFDLPLDGSPKTNKYHTKLIVDILIDCFTNFSEIINNDTFGVVSPFRVQNSEIYKHLPPELQKIVTIDTIERFQGSEREIILLSLPFNNINQVQLSSNLLRLSEDYVIDRKLNVALSRAREFLGIFGNLQLLSKSKTYSRLIEFLKEEKIIISLGKKL